MIGSFRNSTQDLPVASLLRRTVARSLLLLCGLVGVALVNAQGNEDFSNIPANATNYADRSWTGTDGVTWTATLARTDQTLNGKAICTNGSGKVTSPVYTGGMGVLEFNYVRGFTTNNPRTFTVWVNGIQIGGTTTVSGTSDVVAHYSATVNVAGNVSVEIRTGGIQIIIDDIEWSGYAAGPVATFATTTSAAIESVGTPQTITLSFSPATTAAGTVTISIGAASTATYGTDYTTSPAAALGIFVVNIPSGVNSATFSVNILDDLYNEPNETVVFKIIGSTGGINVGSSVTHTFTIQDDDNTTSIGFRTTSVTALENSPAVPVYIDIVHSSPPTGGNITVNITNGAGAIYGATPTGDYITAPAGGTGTFTFPYSPTTTFVNFTVDPQLDGVTEPTETVTFSIVSAGAVIGPNATMAFNIGDVDSPPAVFAPGDLAIVGVNANEGACGGINGEDRVSFFCFQEITYGTELILTDNGYERCNPGQWGNTEGTVRMKRIGPAIPAGQVISFKFTGTPGPTNVISLAPDGAWECTSIGLSGTSINLNYGGDQLFFMQGGTWNNGTTGANNATYVGTILYAVSTNPLFPWSAACPTISTGHSAPFPESGSSRSNLPPGMSCYSSAPTTVSDYTKYAGSITTPGTQRDWIIRIEDPTKWNSYATCNLYNTTGTNWLSAPILPITPGTMTNGLWRGAVNTDWFNCKNWDDARIPDATTDVVIPETAIQACDIGLAAPPGLNPGGAAVCASLLHITSTNAARPLIIKPSSSLTVGGLFRMQNLVGASTLPAEVQANGILNAASIEIIGNTPGSTTARLRSSAAGSQVNVTGSLTIGTGGVLDLQLSPTDFGTLKLGGNFVNQEDELHFRDIYSTVILNGTADQYIQNSDPAEKFEKLKIAKTGGAVYLTAPITIRTQLDLTQGRLFSTPTELITLNAGGTVINTSNSSFVHGPLQKIGITDFTFPIGKNNTYRPASLSGITGGGGSAFTAEYFYGNMAPPLTLAHEATLNHVSDSEHWEIDRSAGVPNAFVTLSWNTPTSGGVTNLPDLRVAYWNETLGLWENRGNGATTGNITAGTVTSGALQTSFASAANYWTLASVSLQNPLPIELLAFTAVPVGSSVDLRWSTASEQNNDHFTVERSADAISFTPVLQVPGAGNSQQIIHYADEDRSPLNGLSYYRLRQTDLDGTTRVSNAVPVFFNGKGTQPLTVLYGSGELFLQHSFAPGSVLDVMDLTGRVLSRTVINHEGLVRIPLDGLARGVYLLRLSDGQRVESTRVSY